MPRIDLPLDAVTLQALCEISHAENVTLVQVIRAAIERDLYRRTRAKRANRTDERLVAPIRALLAQDFAQSANWPELIKRLEAKGFALQEAGAGLALVQLPNNRRVAKASDLGASYGQLMRRFRAPFPGHRHTYLFDRVLREGMHCDHTHRAV